MIYRFRDLSIRQKLTVIALATTGAALALACTVFVVFDQITARHALERDIVTTAKMISANTSAALLFGDEVDANRLLTAFAVDKDVVHAAVYDRTGALFASYSSAEQSPRQAGENVDLGKGMVAEKRSV